ncbi:hypothetical protein C7271_09595 [filamentous cyanobacterium CCP5]|nr:hypothetical protein C7271_09595 [filamentous cyanobacterium CCP5]
MAAQVFISYAPEDEIYRNELVKHLKLLQTSGVISIWHDRKILPGSVRDTEIDTYLNSADLILLLVSVDFINSDYCWQTEVKRAVERHTAGEAIVVPVIVRTVDWQAAPFGQLKPLPEGGKPVRTWPSTDVAMDNVVRGIRQLIEAHQRAIAERTFYEQLTLFLSDGHLSSEEREVLIQQAQEFGLTVQQAETLIAKEESQKQAYINRLEEYRNNFLKFSRKQYPKSLTPKQEEILKSQQTRWQLSSQDVESVRSQVIHLLKSEPAEPPDGPPLPPSPPPKPWWHKKTVIASTALGAIGILSLGSFWWRQPSLSQAEVCPPQFEDGLSSGEETVFSRNGAIQADLDELMPVFNAFKACNDYATAISHLNNLFADGDSAYSKDPELKIYLNNALARQAALKYEDRDPYVLAVAIPASNENSANVAQEILRGVADAQEKFNLQQGNAQGRLLEIVIADDQDNPVIAENRATQLASDGRVLGVIGHRSSKVTAAAIDKYEAANIPVISSTSTSTPLRQHENFFRTVPSDEDMSRKLVACLEDANVGNILLYYDSNDTYSNSWQESIVQLLPNSVKTVNFHTDNISASLESHSRDRGYDLAVIVPSRQYYSDALLIIEQNSLRNNNERLPLVGTDILYEEKFLKDAQQSAKGMVLVVPWFLNESSDYGRNASEEWSGDGSTISWRHATSYEAATAFVKTLQTIQTKSPQQARSDLLTNLRQVDLGPKDAAGIPLKFDGQGERLGYRAIPQGNESLEEYTREPIAFFVEVTSKEGDSANTPEDILIGVESADAQWKFSESTTCVGSAE